MSPSVGLVLVSHSARVADGLAEMLREVAGREVVVAPAGGTEDGRLGTSDGSVRRAIEDAHRGAGVVVLADLGSAVLTARLVIADLADSVGEILLVDAPFVEGSVAAAVTASTGADLRAVADAARQSWHARKL